MFKQQEKNNGFKEVETIIGPSVKVKGNFHSQGNIVVEGIFEGSIKTNGNIFIGDKAKISANIEAKEARIGGEVIGNIKVKEYLEIVSSAKIFGDVEYSSISVERGAVLNGKCTMSAGIKKENGETSKIAIKKN